MSGQLDDGVVTSAVAPWRERSSLRRSSSNYFISYSGSCIVNVIRSGITTEGVIDLSPMLGITTPWTKPAIMFSLPNK